MSKLEAVIFDLDGVLVFSDEYHYLAWKTIADKLGIYFDREINNRLRGVSRMNSLEIILENYNGPALSEEQKKDIAEEKNGYYREYLSRMSPSDVSEDVLYTLDQLKKRGYKTAIGSSSKNSRFILQQVGLIDSFDAISDGTNISRSKPDPEVFVKAAEYLGIKPENCLVVEDSVSGIRAAAAGGMSSAAIGDAVRSGEATYCINIISDILDLMS